jgi:hypothetical protein
MMNYWELHGNIQRNKREKKEKKKKKEKREILLRLEPGLFSKGHYTYLIEN